jgi:hypothetical protein
MKALAKAKKMKRFSEGGEVEGDFVEAGSGPSEDAAPMETSESKAEAPAKAEYKSFKEAFAAERKAGNKTFEYMGKKYTTDVAAPRKEAAKPAAPAPKAPLRQETMRERAESYVAKRAAARAEAAAADKSPKGQDRIFTGIKKNAGENKLMGVGKYANGGVVKRATVKSHGKAC